MHGSSAYPAYKCFQLCSGLPQSEESDRLTYIECCGKVTHDDNKVLRIFLIIRDITQQKQLENALRESKYRWKFAIEGSGIGLWDWNIADDTVYFSKCWKEMLGFTEHEVGDALDEWEKRIHPDDKAGTLSTMQAHLSGKLPTYSSEHRIQCKDDSYKWILDRGIVVSRRADGKPLRMLGTYSDITELKHAQQAIARLNEGLEERIHKQNKALTKINLNLMKKIEELRRSKHQLLEREVMLNSIFNASIEGIITIDMSDIIVSANTAVETIFGYKPEELIGSSISLIMQLSPKQLSYCCPPHTVTSADRIREIEGRHKNGSAVPLDLSVAEFSIDNAHYLTNIVRDISSRKQRERQDKEHLDELAHVTRLGLMGEMASGIAHEVNQPLAAISSYTQASINLLRCENADLVKFTEILYKTQQQALRAGQIIHRMREFVKPHSKHLSITDINCLIHDAVGLCIADIKQNDIRLTFELENNLPLI